MTRIIMCGCNGKMGRVISQLVKEDENAEIVAGVDISGEQLDTYPVFKKITECNVEADAVIDFSAPVALDDILSVGIAKNLALVLCTTGYSEEEIPYVTMYHNYTVKKRKESTAETKQRINPAKKKEKADKLTISILLNLFLTLLVVGMFAIAYTSEHPNLLNYERAIVDKYAAWEQDLTEREDALREEKLQLGN